MTAVEWLENNIHSDTTYIEMYKLFDQAKEMEQANIENKAVHFAEWLTKKHTLTLMVLYERFNEEYYGDK